MLTDRLRARPPFMHGEGDYFGLAWVALRWLEAHLDPSMTTLETGTGTSTVVFAAAGCDHTAVSPDPAEHGRIAAYCEQAGIDLDAVRFVAESSTVALAGPWDAGELDLALIDGAHAFPYPVLDWHHIAPHLRVGGLLLIDDAHLPPVGAVVRHLRGSSSWRLEEVLGYRTPLFRKLDDAPPPVEPDWTGGRRDQRPRFDYLPPARRLVTWGRHRLIDRSPLLGLVRRRAARRGGTPGA